jgi:photosystem II stability/assembly factor-like uncharacterized protein
MGQVTTMANQPRSLKCFVASAFGRPDVDEIYHQAILPVLISLGIEPLRLDRVVFNDDIDDQMLAFIDRCDFCIADLTYARPSVYFEAGHVSGLGKPVIYMARSDHLRVKAEDVEGARGVHFDPQMKDILKWTAPNKTLRKNLTSRIRVQGQPIVRRLKAEAFSRAGAKGYVRSSSEQKLAHFDKRVRGMLDHEGYREIRVPHPPPGLIAIGWKKDEAGSWLVAAFAQASFTKNDLTVVQSGPELAGVADALRQAQAGSAERSHGWAVGEDGTLLATKDGGTHWGAQSSGTTSTLRGVKFVDALHGWAVGDSGAVLATKDGGAHWGAQRSRTTNLLASVDFVDHSHGWAVGDAGTIQATKDGGAHWGAQRSGTGDVLFAVSFVDASHGWVVGRAGTVLVTEDGGAHWSAQRSRTTNDLVNVRFVDASHGWAVGDTGTILATKDGGTHWRKQRSGTQAALSAVAFVDARHGWAVGSYGTILATGDGGGSWTQQDSGTTQWLASVFFPDASYGWVVGDGGTILATQGGGLDWRAQTSGTTSFLVGADLKAERMMGFDVFCISLRRTPQARVLEACSDFSVLETNSVYCRAPSRYHEQSLALHILCPRSFEDFDRLLEQHFERLSLTRLGLA